MDNQNKRPESVQLELFPETFTLQGGGISQNQSK